MKNKNGISAVVATVLIILITVAAVTIIWAAIIPMVGNQLESGTICLDAVSQVQLLDSGYTCVSSDGKNVSIQIKHGAKSFELADIQVSVSAEGTTSSFSLIDVDDVLIPTEDTAALLKDKLPEANEEKVFVINTSRVVGSIDKVQIAPIVVIGNTQETCDISATKVLAVC